MLGQPDRGHRVEAGLRDVAVVAVADLGEIGQALVGDRVLRPHRLLLRQGDADGLDAVGGGVADHAAPAAADVEQPVAGLQAQLLEHQPVLVLLRLLQRRVGVRVAGAGVGHRRAEHPLVERVGHVVVVVDGLRVTGLAVPQAFCDAAPPRQRLLRRRRDGLEVLDADGPDDVGHHPRRRPLEVHLLGQRLEQLVGIAGVHTVRFEVAGDVGAGQPQIAGSGGQVGAPRGAIRSNPSAASSGPAVLPSYAVNLSGSWPAAKISRISARVSFSPAPPVLCLLKRSSASVAQGHRRCTAFA